MKEKLICKGNCIRVYDPKKDKNVFVGRVHKNYLVKKVNPEIHYYNKGGGYPIQRIAINYLLDKRPDIKYIKIIETGKGEYKYRSRPKDWRKLGRVFDEGHGVQICLRLKYMEKRLK